MMFYNFKIHKEKKGFWAECLELKGCVTQADTYHALLKNMEEIAVGPMTHSNSKTKPIRAGSARCRVDSISLLRQGVPRDCLFQ